ncbi:hypothetical protein GCM10018772_24040 [Streptomyces fumanus]|uniref:Transposase n=1 Tax=Streptomyces fumanus TaxID=67302 RepID=A0A919DYM6_9ACTN|nr:hypothetical protein GCM10018772_24040 [Streptomyces fumanus]
MTNENENGRLTWISAAPPGRTHDNTAARHDAHPTHLRAAGLGALPDLGFRGLDNGILDHTSTLTASSSWRRRSGTRRHPEAALGPSACTDSPHGTKTVHRLRRRTVMSSRLAVEIDVELPEVRVVRVNAVPAGVPAQAAGDVALELIEV